MTNDLLLIVLKEVSSLNKHIYKWLTELKKKFNHEFLKYFFLYFGVEIQRRNFMIQL